MSIKNKKLLCVIGSLNRGGCETHLLKVLPELKKKGMDISIFLLADRGTLAQQMEESDITLVSPWILSRRSKKANIFSRLFRLVIISLQFSIYIIRSKPDFIHFFLPASYWLGAPLSYIFSRAKLIMSRRSLNNYMVNNARLQRYEKFLHNKMHFILGNSQAVVDQLIVEELAPTNKTGLIYNGVESPPLLSINNEPAGEPILSELSIPPTSTVMTMVANLIPYKGHSDLLSALSIVSNYDNDWHLLIVGRDDGIGQSLKSQASKLMISDNTHFLGLRNDVPQIYAASNIGLLSSHEEGFSNAILEGMLASLPMIVTDVGGNAEVVENNKTGYVVPASSPKEFAAAILKIINDPALQLSMGKAGRKRIDEKFSMETCINNYAKLYCSLSTGTENIKQKLDFTPG